MRFTKSGRENSYVAINFIGLTLAFASTIVLFGYIKSDLTYDQHHINHERIFRIVTQYTAAGRTERFASAPHFLSPLVESAYPELFQFVRFRYGDELGDRITFKAGDVERSWEGSDIPVVDPNIFDVFTHKEIYGDLSRALADPSSIAISESFARSYFGDQNPIGKTLKSDLFDYKVSAVFGDLPDNSHLKYKALISLEQLKTFGWDDRKADPRSLFRIGTYTYFITKPGFNQEDLQHTLDAFYKTNVEDIAKDYHVSGKFHAQPLEDIHFDNDWRFDQATGNIFQVYALVAIAGFVLFLACVNHANLSTARATLRAKEIGIRKILGATHLRLAAQFTLESFGFVTLTVIAGLVLVYFVEIYTPLSGMPGKENLIADDPLFPVYLSVGTILFALLSGIYPVYYLSSITPTSSLTGQKTSAKGSIVLRQTLVFIQCLTTVTTLCTTIMMSLQMNFIAGKHLGFDNENLVIITLHGVEAVSNIPIIKNELRQYPEILGIAETSHVPGEKINVSALPIENRDSQMEPTPVNNITVGQEFITVMGIELTTGRDFSEDLFTDVRESIVVNEALVQTMGWENPLGKRITIRGTDAKVIGVAKNFHFASFHQIIDPLYLKLFQPENFSLASSLQRNAVTRKLVIKVTADSSLQAIDYIDSVISGTVPKHRFELRFLNELHEELYNAERNLLWLSAIFTALCVFLSFSGLYGLVAYTTERRTKEVGIRKVIGASAKQIVYLLSKDIIALTIVASALGCVLSYLGMQRWLSKFAYHVESDLSVFLIPAILVILTAFLIVVLRSLRAVNANIIETLRYE